jgi:glycosyltransferase involved in cell wall biosynthesis
MALRRLAAHAFRRADAIICQSEFMRDDLSRSLGLPAEIMRIVPNPVDFARVAVWSRERNPFDQSGAGPHVLAVGRLVRAKGFDRLLQAFPALRARRPAAQLWIVGDGPERDSLENQALELGIAPAVHFAGMQENPYCWMRHADLMAVSSRREGMPNAVLEAIACGCPLVVLDHPGGTREVLRLTGQAECVVSDLTPWNDDWFQRPAPLAEQHARARFDRDVVVREYLRMIQHAIAAASPEVAPLRTPAAA